MTSYDAIFSVPAHIPRPGAGSRTVEPSLCCLYGVGQEARYDRYSWDPNAPKPWSGGNPEQSGSLVDLFSIDPFQAAGGPSLDGTRPLDAALCMGNPSEVYLFQGELCRIFSVTLPLGQHSTDSYAKPIAQVFGSVENNPSFAFSSIDTVLYSSKDNSIWFFNGPHCIQIDADSYIAYQPTPVPIGDAWRIPQTFYASVSAAPTEILVTDPVYYPNGSYQDRAYLNTGTIWCTVAPSIHSGS